MSAEAARPRMPPPEPPVPALPPPRVAVVLAAGESERLREITGGGSKALVRIGGLALVERAVRTALAAGVDEVVVVVGYHAGPVAAVARRAAPGRVRVVIADEWQRGNAASLLGAEEAVRGEPSLLVLVADHLLSEDALQGVIRAERPAVLTDPAPPEDVLAEASRVELAPSGRVLRIGTDAAGPVAECGVFLVSPRVFEAARVCLDAGRPTLAAATQELAEREPMVAVPLRRDAWWQDVDTPEDLERARRKLRRGLRRTSDGPVSRLLNRPLSIPVSWALAPLRPNPDALSLLAFVVGVGAAVALGLGAGIVGGILAQLCSVLDGVDGEVARLTLRAGPRGTLLDGYLDRLGDAAIVAGLGVWAAGEHGTVGVVLAVAAAATGAMLSMATKDRVAALGLEPPSERRLGWFLGGRDGRLFLIAVLAILGHPLWALVATAVTSLMASGLRVAFARAAP
jgi:choline kinase/phosphatidylglycerophosphate synthase